METNEEPCRQLARRFFCFRILAVESFSVWGESFVFLELLISAASLGVGLSQ
ncbi:hypothetical protein R0K05_16920 [Planococcus sp. SIMBA_160]